MENMFNLSGKVALVTGASSGLGADAALAYAKYGAEVALFARRVEKLEEVAKKIKAETGKDALVVGCDVTNSKLIGESVQKVIDHFGRIDILLNNAGVAIRGDVVNLSEDDWDKGMDVNVKGLYLMSKHVIPHMSRQKYGRVVNVASVNAVIADKSPAMARHVYNASKSAVLGLTIGMAATYMAEGISVNAIGPGFFESEMTVALIENEAFVNFHNSLCPASRAGGRGELNGTIIYLSSDAVSFVTGQYIKIDGGLSIV